MCDDTGYKDHAGFAMDPCDHVGLSDGGGAQPTDLDCGAGHAISACLEHLHTPRPLADWREDMGDVLWHLMPIQEPPHCGTPIDTGWPYFEEDVPRLWFTPLPDARAINAAWHAAVGDDLGEGLRHG